jgi:hypothetical protein
MPRVWDLYIFPTSYIYTSMLLPWLIRVVANTKETALRCISYRKRSDRSTRTRRIDRWFSFLLPVIPLLSYFFPPPYNIEFDGARFGKQSSQKLLYKNIEKTNIIRLIIGNQFKSSAIFLNSSSSDNFLYYTVGNKLMCVYLYYIKSYACGICPLLRPP